MPQAKNLEGTDALKFQLGIGGPQSKANGGAIETRNAADAAFGIHRAADPVGADDLATKRYVDASAGGALAPDVTGTAGANRVEQMSGNAITGIVVLPTLKKIRQTQGAPATSEDPFVLAESGTGRRNSALYMSSDGVNYVIEWGRNVDLADPTKPSQRLSAESEFFDGSVWRAEFHCPQGHVPIGWHGSVAAFDYRAFTVGVQPSGLVEAGIGVRANGQFYVLEGDTGQELLQMNAGSGFRVRSRATFAGSLVNYGAGLVGAWLFGDEADVGSAACGYWQAIDSAFLTSIPTKGLWIGALAANGGSRRALLTIDGAHKGIQLFTMGTDATGTDFGGGDGVLGISNATTVPTTNPAAGVIAYAEGGRLKTRTQLGTAVTLAPGFIANTLPVVMADADKVLTAAETENCIFDVTDAGVMTADRKLTLTAPPVGKVFGVQNSTTGGASALNIRVTVGATTINVGGGKFALFRTDATGTLKRMTADV